MRRAIGIVRVSEVGDREGDSFASPIEQRERVKAACLRDSLKLVETIEELDVSGGTPLERRAGLRRAIETIENGDADVIVAAYFDRLVRSLKVQAEMIERVEAAGGAVLALDVGHVTNGSAGQWLSATMLGAVAEYHRRTTAERTFSALTRAVARGVAPWPGAAPGYVRSPDGVHVPDPATAPLIAEAFTMRAGGATIAGVRGWLAERDVKVSYTALARLLQSRIVLGELHYGSLINLQAHEPIVDIETWQRAQGTRVPAGRRPKSERLLARLGVLRCASCGYGLVVGEGGTTGRRYPMYRCSSRSGDCPRKVTIHAEHVELLAVDAVKRAVGDVEGRASIERNAHEAEVELERAQAELDALIEILDPLEPAARRRLGAATVRRDEAVERVRHLGRQQSSVVVSAARDWDRLSLASRQSLVRAVISEIVVSPGRGMSRVRVELVGE